MAATLGSCIGLKSPAVSKFREPYGLCCTSNKNGFPIKSQQCNNKNDIDVYSLRNGCSEE